MTSSLHSSCRIAHWGYLSFLRLLFEKTFIANEWTLGFAIHRDTLKLATLLLVPFIKLFWLIAYIFILIQASHTIHNIYC